MKGLEEIIARFGPAIGRVASSYEADPFLHEDLIQEILLAIHRSLPALNKASSLAPFIFRIAHNRGVSHVIRQVGAKRPLQVSPPDVHVRTPEEELLAGERSQRLQRAVRRLPLPYRQVMTLLLEELSYAQIGEALGLTVSNVGIRVNRAKAQLKAMLDDE